MAKVKINALRRAILLTMDKAGYPKGKIKKTQNILNKCLFGGIESDFKKAVAIGNSLPRELHGEVIGRFKANLRNNVE